MDETIEGYMALCICILCNVSPDVAFRCYETGRANVTWTCEDMQEITKLRERGLQWKEIADLLGADEKRIMKIYSYYKKKGMV